jgi:hypothetical protein
VGVSRFPVLIQIPWMIKMRIAFNAFVMSMSYVCVSQHEVRIGFILFYHFSYVSCYAIEPGL